MERLISGSLVCDGVTRNRALQRFVEKRIIEWVREGGTPFDCRDIRFHVLFEREGEGHQIGCFAQVHCRGTVWSGSGLGPSPHQALHRCLAALRFNDWAPLRRPDSPKLSA